MTPEKIQMKANQVVQALRKQEKIKVAPFQIAVRIVLGNVNTSSNKSTVIIQYITLNIR